MTFSSTKSMQRRIAMATVALGLLGGELALARDLKFPEDGSPAFTVTIPDDWKGAPNGSGSLVLVSPHHTSGMSLSLSAADTTVTVEGVHKEVFDSGQIKDANRKEPVQVSGKRGTSYFGTLKMDDGMVVNLKLVLLRVDAAHMGTIAIQTSTKIAPADRKITDKIVKSIAIVGSK